MSDLSSIFRQGAKVVISPDKMRAWITLPRPAAGVSYTAQAVMEWLPQNGVVYGADPDMIQKAVSSGKYDDLLEVARGKSPVSATGGDYTLLIDKKPFTGLKSNSDGSLFYDDISFLQEAAEGQVLAEVVPAVQAAEGMTVTGEPVQPRPGTSGRTLEGSGFVVSADGRAYLAPCLSHVSIVNDQLIVTPLKKVDTLAAEEQLSFEGNIIISGDVSSNVQVKASGSIYMLGRAGAGTYIAGNNVLFSNGLRVAGTRGTIEAKGNVWGLCFESVEITAGGELCANHLLGCDVKDASRISVLGGRAAISNSDIRCRGGVVCGQLGSENGERMTVACGMDQSMMDNYNAVNKKTEKLSMDIQALQQSITTFERINRMKADKGKSDPKYKAMVAQRDQSISVLEILNTERTRMKRTIEQASAISIIVKTMAFPGVTVIIDTRSMNIMRPLPQTKFRRVQDNVEAQAIGTR